MASDNRHSAIESNNAFTAKVEDLVREIVIQNNILYYRIESRVDHVADAAGEDSFMPVIRIITYFEDSVSQISNILHTEFDIATENIIDKKKVRVENFSYKHVQYLVSFKANRRELTEYKRSGNKKFEVQICSMLQDAWAGIEKELGYDSDSFPQEGKRDLYRVGALLEMADLEFLKIRSKFISQPTSGTEDVTVSEPIITVTANTTVISAQVQTVTPSTIEDDVVAEQAVAQHEEIKETFSSPVVPVIEKQEVAAAPVVAPLPQVVVETTPVVKPTAPAPTGLAPKPAKFEVIEAVAATGAVAMVAESILPAAAHIETIEPKTIVAEKIPEPVYTAPVVDTAPAQPLQNTVTEVPKVAEPVMQHTTEQMKVNAGGSIEKATENIDADSVPFFEDLLVEDPAKATIKQLPLDENAPITDASLKEYVLKSKLLKEIDKQIADRAGAVINNEIDIEGDVERLRFLKVYTLKQLHDRLKDNTEDVVSFAEKWIGKDNGGSFDSGISLFYLEYLLVGKKNDPAFAVEYVVKFISDNDYSARYIIPTYNSVRNTEAPNFSHLTLK